MKAQQLEQRLFRLAAEIGDLHLHRRGPARQLAEIDALVAAKMVEADALKHLLIEEERADRADTSPPPPADTTA